MKKASWNMTTLVLLLLMTQAVGAKGLVYTGFFSNTAVGGYDPVSYFTVGKPLKGKEEYRLDYQGARWYFSSAENLNHFEQDPEKFTPQYGGYCAWAVGHGITAKGDPLQWTIHNDKLYLNLDADIKSRWLQEKDHWIEEADRNWPKVLD